MLGPSLERDLVLAPLSQERVRPWERVPVLGPSLLQEQEPRPAWDLVLVMAPSQERQPLPELVLAPLPRASLRELVLVLVP